MQRCLECGYSANKPGSTHCEKCGTALAAPQQHQPISSQDDGKKTVKGGVSNLPSWDEPPETTTFSNQNTCFKCGYPLLELSEDCPNCGTNNSKVEQKKQSNIVKQQKPSYEDLPPVGGTMKISDFGFNARGIEPKMHLVCEKDGKVYEFEGSEIVVNRNTLDKNNNAISSNVHARFEHTDGIWSVSDESSNQATFIQVVGKIEIAEGMLILIGNQFYRFKNIE